MPRPRFFRDSSTRFAVLVSLTLLFAAGGCALMKVAESKAKPQHDPEHFSCGEDCPPSKTTNKSVRSR